MASYSSTLAWKIPWTEEPGGLRSMGSRRVGHDWATSLSLFTLLHWRRKWQPTPMFLPGESQGRWSLVGCRLWGRTGLDTTERLSSSSSSSQWMWAASRRTVCGQQPARKWGPQSYNLKEPNFANNLKMLEVNSSPKLPGRNIAWMIL